MGETNHALNVIRVPGDTNPWLTLCCRSTGFGMAECTWQLEHTIPRPERLVAEFEAAAAREGQNVHNMASIFMLQEVLLEPDL